MGWMLVAFIAGFVLGSFFPQPQWFTDLYDKIKAKFE
jgi:hypothetical protein